MKIHPTAIIDSSAILADDVIVGAYSIIGAEVELGAGLRKRESVEWLHGGAGFWVERFNRVGQSMAGLGVF